MKKILYVFSGEKAQGAEIVIERLMAYNSSDVDAHLFIAPGEFSKKLLQADNGYHITTLKELRRLFREQSNGFIYVFKAVLNHFRVSYKVWRYLKKEKIDVIHANNIVASSYLLPAVFFSKLFMRKKKWVWSDHDMGYRSGLDKSISKMAARMYHSTLAVSGAVTKKYRSKEKLQVLYNGLDTKIFQPNTHSRTIFRYGLNLPVDAIIIGMAGAIVPGKGQLGLMEVFNLLLTAHPNIYLIIAGGFSVDNPAYSEKVKTALASNERIIYLGFLDDMAAYYNGCDIVVSNSDNNMSESLGTTIYEAMAFEKIVVASDTGGTPEIITHNIDGYLFEAGNMLDLRKKLQTAISNYPCSAQMKKMAREKVIKRFNILKMATDYNQFLDRLLSSKA